MNGRKEKMTVGENTKVQVRQVRQVRRVAGWSVSQAT